MKWSRDPTYTGGVGDPETTDLDRRSADGIKFGKIKEVDYKGDPPRYRVVIGDESDEDNHNITDWLPAAGARAKGDVDTHFLEVGENVMLLSEGGELATAQVMPAGTYTKDNEDEKKGADKAGVWRKKFNGGAEVSYDRGSGALLFNTNGKPKGQDGKEQEVSGTAKILAGKGTFYMEKELIRATNGKSTLTMDGETNTLEVDGGAKLIVGKDSITAMVGSASITISKGGVSLAGDSVAHNGKGIGDQHIHIGVTGGDGQSGPPA